MKKLLYIFLGLSLIFACSDDGDSDSNEPCPSQPELETSAVTIINFSVADDSYEATLNGNINNIPLGVNCEVISVTTQGFVYDTSVQPTISDNVLEVNGQQVNSVATGLSSDATYYVRTFLTNPLGTFYGNEISFETSATPDLEPPVITILGDNPLELVQYEDYEELGATAIDNVDGDITNAIEISSNINIQLEGAYEVTYSVSDSSGNTSSVIRIVEVSGNAVYLDENGITIKAYEWAEVGMIGEVNGVTYTIVDEELLVNMITNNEDVSVVCTSKITNMSSMFNQLSVNGDIGSWDVSNVTNMAGMFAQNGGMIGDISNWDVSSVTNMFKMFYYTTIFEGDISAWDVSSVTDMRYMFTNASYFNANISAWDVSNVTNMTFMFLDAENFNQPIGDWDVSNVTDMAYMFKRTEFNQNISNWDVNSVTEMRQMFNNNYEFNQDLSNWDVTNVIYCYAFSVNAASWNSPQFGLPQPNFTNCNPD